MSPTGQPGNCCVLACGSGKVCGGVIQRCAGMTRRWLDEAVKVRREGKWFVCGSRSRCAGMTWRWLDEAEMNIFVVFCCV